MMHHPGSVDTSLRRKSLCITPGEVSSYLRAFVFYFLK